MHAWGRRGARAIGGIVLLACATNPTLAQESNDARCRPATVWLQSPAQFGERAPMHPRNAVARWHDLVERDAWVEVIDSVAADFIRNAPPGLQDVARSRMLRHFSRLRDSLLSAERIGIATDRRTLAVVKPEVFRPSQVDTSSDYILFEDDDEISVPRSMAAIESQHLCWTAITVLQLMNVYSAPAFAQAAEELQRVNQLWDNYSKRGYSRLPWEMALNDWFFIPPRGLEPPATQLIFLHPSVAFEVRGPTAKNLTRDEVAIVEPIGLLRFNGTRTFFYGASLALSFPAEAPAGIGGLVHLGKHLTFGYVWRSADSTGTKRNAFVASLDAYGLFAKVPEALVKAKATAGASARIAVGRLLEKMPP